MAGIAKERSEGDPVRGCRHLSVRKREVAESRPNAAQATMEIRGAQTFEPVTEGTRMRWGWELRPLGFMRPLGPLIASMGRQEETSGPTLRYTSVSTIRS